MAKTGASEMKRIIAAIKRRDPLADARRNLLQRPHRRIHRGRDEESLRRSLTKEGLDFDEINKINKTLRRGQLERLRALEKRPARDEESVAATKELLRHWIEERRRSAEWLAAFNPPSQPTRVYLDTPFLIWANPSNGLLDSNAKAWNSTAQFDVGYTDEIPANKFGMNTADAWVNFYFLWENDTGQDVVINTETILVVKGHGDCFAHAGLIPLSNAASSLYWTANFQILEWWNHPETSPVSEANQWAVIADLFTSDISPEPFWPDYGDRQLIDVFRGYPLAHSSFFGVPRNGSLVFEVGLNVGSGLEGGGWCSSQFAGNEGFVACPFVELQVAAPGMTATIG